MVHAVTKFRRQVGTLILGLASVMGSTTVIACGFEDPKSASIARGGLNWSFPNALHVTSAVWQAQLSGVIPRTKAPVANTALLGYAGTVKKLSILRERLSASKPAIYAPAFSLVLIGPMLWSRFSRSAETYAVEHHVAGPSSGDVVVVTDAPVIQAIVEGGLAILTAEELGLILYYGPKTRIAALREVLKTTPFPPGGRIKNTAARGD